MTPGRSRQAAYELACDQWDRMKDSEKYDAAQEFYDEVDPADIMDGKAEWRWLEKRTEELMEPDGEREDGEDR